jgi:uncharacterized OB-fold protein
MKLEPIVKTFYDGLEEGKLYGRKCKNCGAIEFPPHPACNTCGTRDTEWVELSGRAELLDFVLPGPMVARPFLEKYGDYVYGTIHLEEGPYMKCVVFGINKQNADEINAKLPLPVHPKIGEIPEYAAGDWKALFFELD